MICGYRRFAASVRLLLRSSATTSGRMHSRSVALMRIGWPIACPYDDDWGSTAVALHSGKKEQNVSQCATLPVLAPHMPVCCISQGLAGGGSAQGQERLAVRLRGRHAAPAPQAGARAPGQDRPYLRHARRRRDLLWPPRSGLQHISSIYHPSSDGGIAVCPCAIAGLPCEQSASERTLSLQPAYDLSAGVVSLSAPWKHVRQDLQDDCLRTSTVNGSLPC